MARELLVTKMQDVALEGTVVTPQEIEQEYRRRNDKVKIQYVKITGDKLRSEVQVTPDELRKYYEANKAAYQVPEKRDFGIVIVDQAKLEQTIQPTDTDLLRVYNENKDTYRIPERVNVRHILLKTTEKDPKQEAAVKAKADDLVKQLRKPGANFSEMANRFLQTNGKSSPFSFPPRPSVLLRRPYTGTRSPREVRHKLPTGRATRIPIEVLVLVRRWVERRGSLALSIGWPSLGLDHTEN